MIKNNIEIVNIIQNIIDKLNDPDVNVSIINYCNFKHFSAVKTILLMRI